MQKMQLSLFHIWQGTKQKLLRNWENFVRKLEERFPVVYGDQWLYQLFTYMMIMWPKCVKLAVKKKIPPLQDKMKLHSKQPYIKLIERPKILPQIFKALNEC